MTERSQFEASRIASFAGILACLMLSTPASAQDRAEIEQLQATTQALIDTLVDSGILTREKANALIAAARVKAQAQAQAQSQVQASATGASDAASPELGKDGKRVVRVPFVPESVKREMRDQIKQEVLLQARNERWGEPDTIPAWVSRFRLEGDFRFRQDVIRLDSSNTGPGFKWTNGDLTRAADIAQSAANGLPNFNTQTDFDRQRIRARLGATVNLSDSVSVVTRLATGNLTDRTSTNQSLGQYFNKYSVVVDQAYLSVRPFGDQLTLLGGRMQNPFFSTDLVWADDLGFEGIAATGTRPLFKNATGFLTAGYFPLSENSPGRSRSRSLIGVQAGLDMKLGGSSSRLKLGVALYDYRGLDARQETLAAQALEPEYATRYEYASGFRQRGNTLFNVRAPGDPGNAIYGLASTFRELNVTAALELGGLLPQPVRITGDFVKNIGYDRGAVLTRTGNPASEGKSYGFLARVQVGKSQIAKKGDWNASLAYRYVGSDAVLDAFTNSDFGLGGTNNKGFILGLNYGIYDNTWLSARWMSSNPIDSFAPGSATPTKLNVDTVQLELNTRF